MSHRKSRRSTPGPRRREAHFLTNLLTKHPQPTWTLPPESAPATLPTNPDWRLVTTWRRRRLAFVRRIPAPHQAPSTKPHRPRNGRSSKRVQRTTPRGNPSLDFLRTTPKRSKDIPTRENFLLAAPLRSRALLPPFFLDVSSPLTKRMRRPKRRSRRRGSPWEKGDPLLLPLRTRAIPC